MVFYFLTGRKNLRRRLVSLLFFAIIFIMNGFFRYPGGKSKIKNQILSLLKNGSEYIEPFFGGGSIGLNYLLNNKDLKTFVINDFDYGVYAIWKTVADRPDLLKKRVVKFKPSVKLFHKYRNDLSVLNQTDSSVVLSNIAFKKLVVHQTSYSGLGMKSGGPLGGESQSGDYLIDCRWSPEYICEKIDYIHNLFKKVVLKASSLSYKDVLKNCSKDATIYLDPPYFQKGNDLYQFGFSDADHFELSVVLKSIDNKNWLLSYDDCSETRKLYDWANIREIDNKNTITSVKCKSTGLRKSSLKRELLITPV